MVSFTEISWLLSNAENCSARSQGLGNPASNTLPSCQIRVILSHMSLLGDANTALWLDTLCIPVSAHHRKFRKLAIGRMRETYLKAKHVLVIDRRLMLVPSDMCERRLQLLCSEWMRRLWTLQEGILPKPDRVYVQFADQAFSLRELFVERNLSEFEMCHGLERATRRLLLEKFDVVSVKDRHRLLRLAQHLQARQTTKATDEPICLATLMDVSLDRFASMPNMQQVLTSLKDLPEDLIFAPGLRMQSQGWQWAPATFLRQPTYELELNSTAGVLCDRGFKILKSSIDFDQDIYLGVISMRFIVKDQKGVPTYVFLAEPANEASANTVSRVVESPAIIIAGYYLQRDGVSQGVLVGKKETTEGVVYCHYEEMVYVRTWDLLSGGYSVKDPPHAELLGEYPGGYVVLEIEWPKFRTRQTSAFVK